MRLTCPNCGARYEVADSMIPPEGRDVQCSNCSTTWFQPGRRAAAAESEAETSSPPAPPPPTPEPEPELDMAEETAAAGEESAATLEPDGAAQTPQRRDIDPAVRDILREEAEREARLRAAEAGTVETQAEMPLEEEAEDLHRARRRAELESAEDAFESAEAASRSAALAARDLFPDIDEINSTLRDTGDRTMDEDDASDIDTIDLAPRRRRGLRAGFITAVVIAACAAGLYIKAEQVAAAAPGLAGPVERYVETVDSARVWLDGMAQRLGSVIGEG